MMCGSSKGWTNTSFSRFGQAMRLGAGLGQRVAVQDDSRAGPRVCSTFTWA